MDMDREKQLVDLLYLLSPDVLKENLAKAGLYLVSYEFLKTSIMSQLKGYLTLWGSKSDEDHRSQVLKKHESPFIACCLWYQEERALTAEDVEEVKRIRKHRTDIAHEMHNVLLNPQTQVDESKLMGIYRLLSKIDRWWITEVYWDGRGIRPSGAMSGRMIFLERFIAAVYEKGRIQ